MNGEISELIERNLSEAVAAVQAQIKIPSVKAAPLPNMPFGQPIANALEHMLALGQKLGFTTRNVDGHVGVVEYGTGDQTLGIFCHVDVVPEGMGWTYPPFGAEIHQGRIYGRGAMDNKGPAICTLYALAAIKEADLPLKRRVQVLFGCDEESGWDCMRHYSMGEKLPDIGFSPDAEYPLAYAEKGIIQAYFKKKYASRIKIESGSRVNVIPGEAVAWVPIDASAVGTTDNIRVQADGKMTRITAIGVGGHAAHPENATNAMLILLQTLATLPLEGEDKATVQFLADTLRLDNYGESAGLSYADASGRLTLSPGILQCDHEGFKLALDLRHPVAQKTDEVLAGLKDVFEAGGFDLVDTQIRPAHYVAPESELVQKLMAVYEKHTGIKTDPIATGGATYARVIPNAVSFGCEPSAAKSRAHKPDEYIGIEEIRLNTRVIADAILALAAQ